MTERDEAERKSGYFTYNVSHGMVLMLVHIYACALINTYVA